MGRIRRHLVTHSFKGGRFDDHGLRVDVLQELIRYKDLLVETAKELWRRRNPGRERLPRNFEDSLSLSFYEIEPGSTCIPLERTLDVEEGRLFVPPPDELDEAADLVADTITAADEDRPIPESFPKNLLALFQDYGRSLADDEWIEQTPHQRPQPARYRETTRSRLAAWTSEEYEDAIDLVAEVTMARVSRPRMALMLDDGREIEAAFDATDEDLITAALKDHNFARVRVSGRGLFSSAGRLEKIVIVDRISLAEGELPFDPSAKPISEQFDEIIKALPEDVVASLPRDGSEKHDDYIYGHTEDEI
jgi:hypothetical protein